LEEKVKKVFIGIGILVLLVSGCQKKSAETASASSGGITTVDEAAAFLKGKSIRVVNASSSPSGDTYVTAEIFFRNVAAKYGCTAKVDPIGTNRALQEIVSAKPDGRTIMVFHDMTYLGVLFGAYDANDYSLEKMVIGGSYGYSNSDCFVASASAPYKTIVEMAQWMKENPNTTVKIAIEAGGVSQLLFNVIYRWVDQTYGTSVASRLKIYVTGATQEKLQALWDGNCQVIYASAPTIQEFTREGVDAQLKMNVLGLASSERYKDEPWPTFSEQGITLDGKPFAFAKEYIVFYPLGMPQDFIDAMDVALADVGGDPQFKAEIQKVGYLPQAKKSKEAVDYFYSKRASFVDLIKSSPDFDDLVD
jgi:tripartite-type tricarboxylate transporter receptor subunit TctC